MDTPTDVRKMGYLKKQKTMKKKLFVLREESDGGPARLEYYDTEKKFVCSRPKRSIPLHNCFSINSKSDSKHKHAIVLYTKEDCFTVICDTEEDKKHIWPVTVKPKGLGSSKHLHHGQYRLCLTSKELSFVRPSSEQPDLVFQLASIRRCGHTECFFFLELGRTAVTGAGDLWMQVEDIVIAQNMHETILSSMMASKADQPQIRPRRHSNIDKSAKPSSTPNRQRGGSSSHNTSALPQRSNTISTADHARSPLVRRLSQSPGKGGGGSNSLRPMTISGHSTLPPLHHRHRSRTDSMESSGSRTNASMSADELESPLEDSYHSYGEVSTPTGSRPKHGSDDVKDDYMAMAGPAHTLKVSPVRDLPHNSSVSDYMEVDSAKSRDSGANREAGRSSTRAKLQMALTGHVDKGGGGRADSKACYMEMGRAKVEESDYMEVGGAKKKEEPIRVVDPESMSDYTDMTFGQQAQNKPPSTSSSSHTKASDTEYIAMNPGSPFLPFEESSYMDMSRGSSVAPSPAVSSTSSLQEIGNDSGSLRLPPGSRSLSLGEEDEYFEIGQDTSYMPMEARSCSPRPSLGLRLDRVSSYLSDEHKDSTPQRSSSVGSRPQAIQNKMLTDSYMDMSAKKDKVIPTKGHQKTSSAPLLNHGQGLRGQGHLLGGQENTHQRSLTLDRPRSRGPSKDSLERCREEKDFLMEMDFNQRRGQMKEHDYEEIRPRSSSGGAHDFRMRNSGGTMHERRRTGSFGYKEKLSKFASLARASVLEYRKSENGHRPRIATISQDTFRKRTSSFGTSAADMRPRSSSHGNSRYVDMSGKLRRDHSSQASQDSVNSTTSDYLDMRPRVSTSPSQALVAMFKNLDKSRQSPRSPLPTDSDYLSMEHGKSSSESSAECASTELTGSSHRSSESRLRVKSRSKRGSTSSGRASHSSSESLASNTSQSSEGRGSDRSKGVSTSTISEHTSSLHPESSRRVSTKAKSLDDSYVLYSPSTSRDPSPQPESKLDKVSSPIRIDDSDEAHSSASDSTGSTVKPSEGHEYVNVDYDKDAPVQQSQVPAVRARLVHSSNTDSGPPSTVSGQPLPRPQSSLVAPPLSELPNRPCPQAPASSGRPTPPQPSLSQDSGITSDSRPGTAAESDYLCIGPQAKKKQDSVERPGMVSKGRHSQEKTTAEATSKPISGSVAASDDSDYVLAGPQSRVIGLEQPGSSPKVAEPQVCEEGSDDGAGKSVAKPRPRLPSMPVPFPTLGPMLTSPASADNPTKGASSTAPAKSSDTKPRTVPSDNSRSSSDPDYIELALPVRSQFGATGSQSPNPLPTGCSLPLPRPRVGSQPTLVPDQATGWQANLGMDAQLSTSKSSLNSNGDKELNYATLDLQTCLEDGCLGGAETSALAARRPKHASGGSGSGASDSPEECPPQYAQIDFKKSEELRRTAEAKRTRAPFDL